MTKVSDRWMWRHVVALIACALLLRSAAIGIGFPRLNADPDAYRQLAETYAETGVFGFAPPAGIAAKPTAFRPPGYPWLLSWFVRNHALPAASVASLHILLGAATAGLTYLVMLRLLPTFTTDDASRGPRISQRWLPFLAGLMVTLDPILLVQSMQVMTETLATCLAVLAIFAWTCLLNTQKRMTSYACIGYGTLLGFALSAGYLVRPVSIVWGGLLIGCAIGLCLIRYDRWPIRVLGIVTAMLLLTGTVTVWTLRNIKAVGAPIWATTHGGYTLLLANNLPLYEHLDSSWWPGYWNPERFFQGWEARGAGDLGDREFWQNIPDPVPSGLNEVEDDRVAASAAKATIEQQPATFLHACLVRVIWLWSPCPQIGSLGERLIISLWYSFIYIGVMIAIWKRRVECFRPVWWCGWCLIIAITVTHAVYWSNLRMRAPAMPMVILLSLMSVCLSHKEERRL